MAGRTDSTPETQLEVSASLAPSPASRASICRGDCKVFSWVWERRSVAIAYETFGTGPPCLLLPAFSTVCTREEMRALAARLADRLTVTLVDWPGFGESSRQPFAYGPLLMQSFLGDFVARVFHALPAVVAAGHAAGYALALARTRAPCWSRIVLLAPTWRGPLPTAMGRSSEHWGWLRRLVRAPFVGEGLYRLNTAAPVIALMYRRHVYANRVRVTGELVRTKQATARRPRGRHASVAFVTGALDLVPDRDSFHRLVRRPPAPTLIVYGADTPPRSRAEMESLAGLEGIIVRVVPGSLAVHEEHPEVVFQALGGFLSQNVGGGT